MFKAMIKFMHTFDISPVNGGLDEQPDIKGIVQAKLGDGTLSYVKIHQNTTHSQLTKARNRWRDWNRASLLEQDDYYITTMEHLNGELEAGRCSPQQYQRHAATLREQVTEQIQKRTKKYEKSIGIIDADFAEQRRAAKAVKAA